jgi:hypothetical protein
VLLDAHVRSVVNVGRGDRRRVQGCVAAQLVKEKTTDSAAGGNSHLVRFDVTGASRAEGETRESAM